MTVAAPTDFEFTDADLPLPDDQPFVVTCVNGEAVMVSVIVYYNTANCVRCQATSSEGDGYEPADDDNPYGAAHTALDEGMRYDASMGGNLCPACRAALGNEGAPS